MLSYVCGYHGYRRVWIARSGSQPARVTVGEELRGKGHEM